MMTKDANADPACHRQTTSPPNAYRTAIPVAHGPLRGLSHVAKSSVIEPRAQLPPMPKLGPSTGGGHSRLLVFGRYRLLPRERQLFADGVPVELGTRAFELLLVLLEGDGSLVTKDELLRRVWPGVVVAEENLKVQIYKLRRALGEDRDFIRTEFGRGYRFTAACRLTIEGNSCKRRRRRRRRLRQGRSRRCRRNSIITCQ
jgi:DNA-binding winged helix-turn-helix (wHTH) protein